MHSFVLRDQVLLDVSDCSLVNVALAVVVGDGLVPRVDGHQAPVLDLDVVDGDEDDVVEEDIFFWPGFHTFSAVAQKLFVEERAERVYRRK